MPKICYRKTRFGGKALDQIEAANIIIAQYRDQDLILTVRQLYYQFVARGLLENSQANYSKLASLVSKARRAGLIDWDAIEDRTRFLRTSPHWADPASMLQACANQFAVDRWATQPGRIEVWIEKDALLGVIEPVCTRYDIPYFSCRGYASDSELWRAAQRIIKRAEEQEQVTLILHLGDHDPSGVDMTRDISARLGLFTQLSSGEYPVRRIALTMKQVEEKQPPPNPAKLSDSRCGDYMSRYGTDSWELDALDPAYLSALIEKVVTSKIDMKAWNRMERRERAGRKTLSKYAKLCKEE